MTTWILMFAIYLHGDGGGISLAPVEFTSLERCQAAGKAMAAEWKRGSLALIDQSRWVCVHK